jgi:hypothetical protein
LAKRPQRPLMMCARQTKNWIVTRKALGNFQVVAVALPELFSCMDNRHE